MAAREMDGILRQAYEHCRNVAQREAKNFYYGFVLLPAAKRRAVYAAYAFSRQCDDAVDDELALQEKRRRLSELRGTLTRSLSGEPVGPVFSALLDAVDRYRIPHQYFHQLIDGVEMDLTRQRYATFEELRHYCYLVASVVGLVCIEIFGYREPLKAKTHAVDLGIALQLINIIRDVKEDARRGRIYIPLDEMERFGYGDEELCQNVVNGAFVHLMRFQAQRAREYLARGRQLLPLLPLRSRACVAVLQGIYGALLDRIEARHYDVFRERASLSTGEKLLLTSKLWLHSLKP